MHSLALLVTALAALRVPGPLTPRTASYRMSASLDEHKREVTGTETITWRNDGTAPTNTLAFHLYMNAFENDASTFFRETEHLDHPAVSDGHWGAIDMRDVVVKRGGVAIGAQVVVPRKDDRTVATVTLDRDIAPGETIEVALAFTTKLPEIVARAGTDGRFFAVAQWYPSIGVWECTPTCAWNAAAYHAESEFYADFGTYDVTLDLPSSLGVAATGVRTGSEAHGTRQTLTYHAEDVHDFVFTADARFVEHAVDVDDGSGLPPVHVVLMGEPPYEADVDRHLAAARAGLRTLGASLGFYPYSQLTIVQVPPGAEEAGGMEYPTLFFTDDGVAPSWSYEPELTTAHELAHQWFQGMVASDEVHEAWLDEGLTDYVTGWVLAAMTPPDAISFRFAGHEVTYEAYARAALQRDYPDAIDTPAYGFSSASGYANMTYRKTELLLGTIAARIGHDAFVAHLRAYADANRWKHPHRADFLAAFADLPPELRQLLEDGLTKPGLVDYAITSISSTPLYPTEGLVDADGGTHEVKSPPKTGRYQNRITVERVGAYELPVTVRARFDDGRERDAVVDLGHARWQRLELDGEHKLVEARLYPQHDTPLDVNTLNDGLALEADPHPRHTLVGSLGLALSLVLSMVGR